MLPFGVGPDCAGLVGVLRSPALLRGSGAAEEIASLVLAGVAGGLLFLAVARVRPSWLGLPDRRAQGRRLDEVRGELVKELRLLEGQARGGRGAAAAAPRIEPIRMVQEDRSGTDRRAA